MRTEGWRETFVVVGVIVLASIVPLLILLGTRREILTNRGIDIHWSWLGIVWCLAAGVGFARCTRWGAILLAAPLAIVFVLWIVSAIATGTPVSLVMALAFSPILLAPAYLTWRHWSQLSVW